MTGAPPILQQAVHEPVAAVAPLQIPVVFEQAQNVVNRGRRVDSASFSDVRAFAIPVDSGIAKQTAFNSSLGQKLEGCPVVRRPEHQSEPGLVVLQVHLPPDGEHFVSVDARRVFRCCLFSTVAAQELV